MIYRPFTISPPPYDGSEQVETLAGAIAYYEEHGIQTVSVQPKYMGSYCCYYHWEGKKYWTTRSATMIYTHLDCFPDIPNNTVIEGELLPWRYFASGLIERDFVNPLYAIRDEIMLRQAHNYPLPVSSIDVDITIRELHKYTGDGEVTFKPFGVLVDRGRVIDNRAETFGQYNQDPYWVVNTSDRPNLHFELEGCVVKPIADMLELCRQNVAPALKVRNYDYLRLIYGPSYNAREIGRNRKVGGKIYESCRQYIQGYNRLMGISKPEVWLEDADTTL
ncbi:MAG: hypothetical protein E6Q36_00245 [Chryseobacterium sp.]|nr:MAG: hypothetical protein E6Q36_00245 [Chryseobacterium sp.]